MTLIHEYALDVRLYACIRVMAPNVIEARKMVLHHLDCADTNFGIWDDGTPILAEASVDDPVMPCFAVDGDPEHPECD